MRINFRIDDAQIHAALARVAAAGRDLTPLMKAIAGHLADSVAESFQRQAKPGGRDWEPLQPQTVAERLRKGYGGDAPILERSGDLANSILSDWTTQSAIAGVSGGGPARYAATHQFGDDDRNIPARPYLGLHSEHHDLILDEITSHILTKWH